MASLSDDVGDAGEPSRLARHFGMVIEYILNKQNISTDSLSLWSLSEEGRQILLSTKGPVDFQNLAADFQSSRNTRSATSPRKQASHLLHGHHCNKKWVMRKADAINEVQASMTSFDTATPSPPISPDISTNESGSTITQRTTDGQAFLQFSTPSKLNKVEEDAFIDSTPLIPSLCEQMHAAILPYAASSYVGQGAPVLHTSQSAGDYAYIYGAHAVITESTNHAASASFPVTIQQAAPCHVPELLSAQDFIINDVFMDAPDWQHLEDKLRDLRAVDHVLQTTPATSDLASRPIHVFIDMSNIIIGWTDMIKKLNGMSKHAHIRAPSFDFGGLDHIVTRGREVGKRAVAGSIACKATASPPQHMRYARALGYDTCVLRRVIKTRGSLREQFYKNDSHNTTSSGDDWLPIRSSEQCVDEVLHLKMVQSVVDCAGQPATAVLVTGDAAEAQFSDGFKANAERLLTAGWFVEIYAWSHNMSASWREVSFMRRWEHQIRLVHLDPFAVDLIKPSA